MEVTTVSPSPASPTEEDNLCEIEVTNMAIHSVTLLICLCGLAGNGAVVYLYSLKMRISSVFDLAVTDFLFLLFTVPSALLFLVEDVSCSPIMPLIYVSFVFQLSEVSYFWGLFRLIFSGDVIFNIVDLCELFCDPPLRLWWVMDSVQEWAVFALFTVIPMVTSLCPSHEQEHCRAALISMYAVVLLFFVVPMVISCTINIIKAWCGSKNRELKWQDIIISLILLFNLLLGLCSFLQQLGYIPVSSQVFFLFTCINSSIKPFIYFLAGKCWSPCSVGSLRLSLQRVFEEEEENTTSSDDASTDTDT